LGFIGIEHYRSLILEGHAALPDKAEAIIKEVYAQIPQVVEWFS
jgi:FMN-dependent NADH-azoreductase